jgi:hypothetical protein
MIKILIVVAIIAAIYFIINSKSTTNHDQDWYDKMNDL